MFFLETSNLGTKIDGHQDSKLQKLVELLWRQISQQLPTLGCLLVSQQDQSKNIIEAVCLSNSFWQDKINYTLLHNLELNSCKSESEIYFDSDFLAYIYIVTKTSIYSRYLIFFCHRDKILSLEQKQILKTQNKLLQYYLDLENKYQQKENDFKSLETLFYQIGHQLRNPLAEISIIAETISLSATTSFGKFQAEDIKNKVSKINLDLRRFLQSYREANYQKNPQDIRKIFQQSVEGLKNLINQKKIVVKYPQTTAFLAIDSFKIKQIFDNLLSNAIYFSPEEESINCYWQTFQKEILINIYDRGCGLSSEDIENMFLPFYSRRENGQGLGLTIVQKIILELKGSIWAENIPQGGTKISFVLPKNL